MSDLIPFKIVDIVRETHNSISIKMIPEDNRKVNYEPGQFLTLIFNIRGREIRRSFSLSSSPDTDNTLIITVKRIINGEISTMLFEKAKTGDIIQSLPPSGRFTLATDKSIQRDIFFIAAGSGITPIYSLLKTILIKEPLSKITLIFCNRNEQSAIFFKQLNELEQKHKEQFKCIYIFSDPQNKDYPHKGHLNLWWLEDLIKQNISFEKEKAEFFLCGPFPFMRMADMMIVVMGFDERQIHKENFVILAEQEAIDTIPEISDKSEKMVEIRFRENKTNLPVPYGKTILKSALENNIHIPYSCKSGICGTCAAICKEGEVKMSINQVLTNRDLQQGWILTCVGYPATTEVVLEIK